MVQPISNHLGYGAINSFFCDSIECDGHNWSGILLDEFQKRRGYDLRPHAYALWGDLGDISPDVRHDYFLTMSELTIENFFEPFTAWSKRNGAQARIQAHGTWADILKAYATADIPEGETFGDQNVLGCNTIHRRLAVSAGHLYGKKIISNETFTWLCKPRFTETPEILKAAVDAVFLDGMNMIVNHGFPYSEPDAEERLPFYASCHLCNDTPWWPHYRHLARYIQTVSALLRRGRHVSEIGIFLPQADIWSDNLLSDLHMAMKLEEHIGRDVADAIAKAGYWFDYLNDDALVRLGSLCEGGIRIGGNEYRVILLIGCTRLDEKTAECLHAFVEAGGVLIAAEQIPLQGCGLMDRKQKDERVRSCIEELFGSKRQPGSVRPYLTYEQCSEESDQNGIRSGQIAPESQSTDVRAFKRHVGKGDAIFVPDRRASLISALQDTLRPDVTLSCPDTVGYVHREEGDTHFYFLSNISPKECRNTAFFRDRHTGFRVFSPETGEEIHAHSFEEASDGMRVVLDHPPYGALVVFFSPEVDLARVRMNGAVEYISETDLVNWTFSVPSLGFTASMPEPTSWEEQPALHYYSGEGRYACTFTLDAEILPDQQVRLVLTSLFCSAEVWVNGFHAGDLWKSPYHLDIGRHLHQGSNNLLLVVTNPLINELLNPGLRDTPLPIVLPYWPYFGNVINNIRQERLSYEAERAAILTPQRSGLSGSVRLCVMNPSM